MSALVVFLCGQCSLAAESATEPDAPFSELFSPVNLFQPMLAPQGPIPQEEELASPQAEVLPLPGEAVSGDGGAWLMDPEPWTDDGAAGGVLIDPLVRQALEAELPAPVYNTRNWFENGNWYAQYDLVMMHARRLSGGTVPNSQTLFIGRGLLAFDTFNSFTINRVSRAVRTDSMFLRFEPGTRITVGRFTGRDFANRDHSLEFTFLGLFEWDARIDFAGQPATASQPPGSVRTTLGGVVLDATGSPTAIFVPGFSDADIQRFRYGSDFNSFEMNFRLQARPERDIIALQPNGAWIRHESSGRLFSLIGGLRVVSINDLFVVQSEAAEVRNAAGMVISPETFGLYTVQTHNDMVGLQLGAELFEKYTRWNWGARGRVGGFTNFADRMSQIETINGIDPRSETIDDENFVTLLEAGVFLAYDLRPNLSVRTAYDVLYIPSGTADADRNLSLQPTFPPLNLHGRRLYQGLSVGCEMVW